MVDQYAVFGNPIEHSKSPLIHQQFAEQTQQAIDYQRQLVAIDGFNAAVSEFFSKGGKGLNITVPFKLEAYAMAEHLTSRAQTAGAVNILYLNEQGELTGDNTDGIGLVNDITDNLGWQIARKKVLVLGAGGAVRGILQPLLEARPDSVFVANRTSCKATELAETFKNYGPITGGGFNDVKDESTFDMIINGTSASIGGELPPIPTSIINSSTCCYDMMYGAEPTVFLNWAKEAGSSNLADGLGMLVGQAAESFFIWRGVRPEVKPIIDLIRRTI